MRAELLKLLEQKVSETLRAVDEKTAVNVRNEWNTISPSPSCPSVGDVMKRINQISHRGLTERGEKARDVVVSTLREVKKVLNAKFLNEIVEALDRHFPVDQYIILAKNTKGVYQQRQTPPHKFDERVFNLEVTAISVGSANLSLQAINNIRDAINELLLQKKVSEPTRLEQVREFIFQKFAMPAVKWVFSIIASVIVVIILYFLGIKG
jgi:hypothetical protein